MKKLVVLFPDGTMMPQGYWEGMDMEKERERCQKGTRFFLVDDEQPIYQLIEWYARGWDYPEQFKEVSQ